MSETNIGVNKDEWNKFAPSFMKLAQDGPGIAPAQDMVKVGHAAYPFTSALTILDIGCGPGQITSELLKAHGSALPESARLIASDLSPGIVEQMEKRKAEEIKQGDALWNKVETVVCDAQNLSAFPDMSVSHALAGFVIFMLPDSRTALREAHRVLTDQNGGGVFAVSSWQGSEWMDLMGFPSKIRPEKKGLQLPPTWRTVEGVRGELEATGFRDVEVHTMEAHWPFDDYDELARFLLTKLPGMARMTGDMTQDELDKTLDLMVAHIKSKYPTTPARLTGTAIVGVGRK